MNSRAVIIEELLKALVPFTEQNLKLAFKPGTFFNDLEKKTHANRNTLAATMSRARRKGLIENLNGMPTLTAKGRQKITHLMPEQISGWLMITFDIPEVERPKRDQFREFLKERGFKTLQKSVWYTDRNHTAEIKQIIAELRIGKYVCLFIAASVFAPEQDI